MLHTLINELMVATCFEEAATAALKTLLNCTQAALARSSFATSGRILRGVVHFRSSNGYQRLFGVEHHTGAPIEGIGFLTSATVWHWVTEHRRSVSIDVLGGVLRVWEPMGPVEQLDPHDLAGVPGQQSRERMLGRDATHVHVIPLRRPGGAVDGMIALEANCKVAIGQAFVWDDCHGQLELFAAVAAAYLGALPPRPIRVARTDDLLPVIGRSTAGIVEILRVFAQQDETVLLSGPTGAGKSRLACWCHEQSLRKGKLFETLDLLSVPEELQMAELFGWKRGAFTGAMKDSAGAIARAAQGTLFIDEIDKLSLKAQAGLLRVLEARRYRPLGDEGPEKVADVRFVVGTNANLREQVRAGKFREDLYYRINVLPVRLPPLSERLDELPQWAEYMLGRRHKEAGGDVVRIASEAIDLLTSVPWPGNLRQLDNILRRAYAITLADRGGVGIEFVVARRHVERALAYDEAGQTGAVFEQFWRAAKAFVHEAERRDGTANPLSLDLIEAQRGLVFAAAVQRRGREEAFHLLGQQPLLKNRNHHRTLKREFTRVREFLRTMGGDVEPELAAVLDTAEELGEGG